MRAVHNIPWRRKRQPTPVFLPGESLGHRGLQGVGGGLQSWGHRVRHNLATKQETASGITTQPRYTWRNSGTEWLPFPAVIRQATVPRLCAILEASLEVNLLLQVIIDCSIPEWDPAYSNNSKYLLLKSYQWFLISNLQELLWLLLLGSVPSHSKD